MPVCLHTLPCLNDGPVPGLHAYKQTSTNEPLNPIASSAIEHGLAYQSSSYPNGLCAPNTMYTHSSMPPLPHHTATNGTAYGLNPAGSYGANAANYDRQRVDHLPPRTFAPGAVHSSDVCQEYHAHSQTYGGFSKPPVWSDPTGGMDASLASSAYPFPATSRSNGGTCEYSILWS